MFWIGVDRMLAHGGSEPSRDGYGAVHTYNENV